MTETAPTVYVVDDDPSVRSALENLISSHGLRVETFPAAQEFLRGCPENAAGCLVLDDHLPGMDGLALLALLRARGVALPALIITSLPTRSLAARAAAAGAAIIEKPLLCDALAAAIRAAVRKQIEPA